MKIRNGKLPLITTTSFLFYRKFLPLIRVRAAEQTNLTNELCSFFYIYGNTESFQSFIDSTGILREHYMYYQAGEAYKKLDTLAIDCQDGVSP